jgi:osmotically-inducible protein OsmY
MNKMDRSKAAITADQQGSSKSDREVTRLIRKSVVSDKALSSYGHNIKIITLNGVVTLKGPVKSEREKMEILNRANTVTGGASVTDEMSVTR